MEDGFLGVATIAVAGCALAVFLPAKVLLFFVALKSRPFKRSAITVAIPYAISTIFVMTWREVSGYWYLVPIIMLPGASIAFWLIYSSLKRRWVEDPEDLPEGVALATEDWKEGMAMLALTALVLAAVVGFKLLWRVAAN